MLAPGLSNHRIMRGHFRAVLRGVDGILLAADNVVVNTIFNIGRRILLAVKQSAGWFRFP